MVDRLQRHGLPHPLRCPLCDAIRSRRRFLTFYSGVWLLGSGGSLALPLCARRVSRYLWTTTTLVFWSLWTHHDDNVVFNDASPPLRGCFKLFKRRTSDGSVRPAGLLRGRVSCRP
ncbi:hypothetical protein BRADI_3g47085v3 [Brachypodium distachyon]|uniref:Uncharacterized protein n=1 Tax=Brachypodium distachyon TaxID=15368 RepID=A0A0Q3M6D7_BRADI|nr:hypothetical protein BRADI_3g47085v3 [Brachypodium distachyon]